MVEGWRGVYDRQEYRFPKDPETYNGEISPAASGMAAKHVLGVHSAIAGGVDVRNVGNTRGHLFCGVRAVGYRVSISCQSLRLSI
jgi:hypothetical protein